MKKFFSSTQVVPEKKEIPEHIAIIMDGNGRWANKRFLPRAMGHKRGAEILRNVIEKLIGLNVKYLTVFAFSSENWRRPADEVSFLMHLFIEMLKREVAEMHKNNLRLIVIGDKTLFPTELVNAIVDAEQLTKHNTGLTLRIAANYGGRWDIMQAVNTLSTKEPDKAGQYTEADLIPHLSMQYAPEPDLLIRTGGESRISNFLLWDLAYTEFYFTETLWPDIDSKAIDLALASYKSRKRRFGRTDAQLEEK